jgi:hypothetical protein
VRTTEAIAISADATSSFAFDGTASHLGRFRCYSEIEFVPGDQEGTLDGRGVAVFAAANGDLIVGIVTCEVDADGTGQMRVSWRDAVEFGDGTIVSSKGHLATSRPPGVVIVIIAILIG